MILLISNGGNDLEVITMDIYPIQEAFVYKWTNTTNNKIYIGKHKGTLNDGYISSGKAFLHAYNANPANFIREIIWNGTNAECLQKEWHFIKDAIAMFGYTGLYNKTHWNIVKGWKRTCMACGEWCDPANEEWADEFATYHFENCRKSEKRKQREALVAQQEYEKQLKKQNRKKFPVINQSLVITHIENLHRINKEEMARELLLCHTDNERFLVNRYYTTKQYPETSKTKKDLIRMRKLLDKKLY